MSWKLVSGTAECFDRGIAVNQGTSPLYSILLVLPPDAPAELGYDADAEAFAAIDAKVDGWRRSSEAYARRLRLDQQANDAAKQVEDLRGRANDIRQAIEKAHYDDAPTTGLEAHLQQAVSELTLAEDRVPRLQRLAVQAKAAATAELTGIVNAARLQEASRLDAEVGKAADEVAGAAESLAGHWYVLSEARSRLAKAELVAGRYADAA